MPDLVGILGGTFDPVHRAHLALARVALERLPLAQVRWIPAGRPPHRDAPHAAAADRLAMVRAAIADEPRFALDDGEIGSAAPSYTVETLERLRRQFGAAQPLVLLMGADAFRGLPAWRRWREIFALAHVAVATRPGFPLDDFAAPLADEFSRRLRVGGDAAQRRLASAEFQGPAGEIRTFELVAGTVSATEARRLVAAGAPDWKLRELLPAPVLDYIRQHRLYSG